MEAIGWQDVYNEHLMSKYQGLFFDISAPKDPSTYKFKGEINFQHLVNDCIKDGKIGFIAISKDCAYVGALRFVTLMDDIKKFDSCIVEPFKIIVINKGFIGMAIKFLKQAKKKYEKDAAKIARKIQKDKKAGKFSNQPETKVIVF